MRDLQYALREWFQLVKPGDHLIVIVPDEDLYKQGYFPSRFNADRLMCQQYDLRKYS